MALAILAEVPDLTREEYELVVKKVNESGSPAGGLCHAAGPIQHGYRIVEVWETGKQPTPSTAPSSTRKPPAPAQQTENHHDLADLRRRRRLRLAIHQLNQTIPPSAPGGTNDPSCCSVVPRPELGRNWFAFPLAVPADAHPSDRAGRLTLRCRQISLGHWQVWVANADLSAAKQLTLENATAAGRCGLRTDKRSRSTVIEPIPTRTTRPKSMMVFTMNRPMGRR